MDKPGLPCGHAVREHDLRARHAQTQADHQQITGDNTL